MCRERGKCMHFQPTEYNLGSVVPYLIVQLHHMHRCIQAKVREDLKIVGQLQSLLCIQGLSIYAQYSSLSFDWAENTVLWFVFKMPQIAWLSSLEYMQMFNKAVKEVWRKALVCLHFKTSVNYNYKFQICMAIVVIK